MKKIPFSRVLFLHTTVFVLRRCLSTTAFFLAVLVLTQAHGDEGPGRVARSNVPTLELRAQRTITPDYRPYVLSLSADGKLLAFGLASDGKPFPARDNPPGRLLDTSTGKEIARFGFGDSDVGPVCISPDDRTIAFENGSGGNYDIELFDVAQRKVVRSLTGHRNYFSLLSFSPNGKLLATVGDNREGLRLWDVATGKQLHRIFTEDRAFNGNMLLAFSPDSKTLALAARGDVHLLDVGSAKERHLLKMPERYHSWPSSLAFSPDGRLLAVGLETNVIPLWDPRDGKLVHELSWEKDHKRPEVARYKDQLSIGPGTMGLSFTADGRCLIAACRGMRVRVWEVASCGLRYQVDEYVRPLAVAPAGSLIAGIVRYKQVCLWDSRTWLPPRPKAPLPDPDKAWSGLANADAAGSYTLMRDLMAAPKETVTLLDKRLSAVARVPHAELERLVADLDDEQFEVRERASRRLADLGEVARDALEKAKNPSAEARRRIKEVLSVLDGPADGERLRLLRAVEVLEIIGTPEAQKLLKHLSEGDPRALLTREAKSALNRLDPK
jgi:WD40 repeat protein